MKLIQKAKEDHIVEKESKEIIKQVTALQRGFTLPSETKPPVQNSTPMGSYNYMRSGTILNSSPLQASEVGDHLQKTELDDIAKLLGSILKKMGTLEQSHQTNVGTLKSQMIEIDTKVEHALQQQNRKTPSKK